MKIRKRYDVINHFIRARRYRTYLEIGTADGRTLERVTCARKVGVDPAPKRIEPDWNVQTMTSNAFFAANQERFDLVFVDGLHHAEQALRDICNGLTVLTERGMVIVDDCLPASEEEQHRDPARADVASWTGDVWKAIAFLRSQAPALFTRVIDCDHGVGIVVPRSATPRLPWTPTLERQALDYFSTVKYTDLVEHRQPMLGLVDDMDTFLREARSDGLTLQ